MIAFLPRLLFVMLPLFLGGAVGIAQIDDRDGARRRALEAQRAAIESAREQAKRINALHGDRAPEYAAALRSLAGVLQEARRFRDAESALRLALDIDTASLGPDHPTVAIDLNELGVLLTDTNRFAEAEPLLRRALAIDEKNLGAEHRNVAADLFNLGVLYRRAKHLAEAEPLLRRALAIEERNFGLEHPRLVGVLADLALLLRADNRTPEAEQMQRRARLIQEKAARPPPAPAAIKKPVPRAEKPVVRTEPRKPPPPRPAPAAEDTEIQRVR